MENFKQPKFSIWMWQLYLQKDIKDVKLTLFFAPIYSKQSWVETRKSIIKGHLHYPLYIFFPTRKKKLNSIIKSNSHLKFRRNNEENRSFTFLNIIICRLACLEQRTNLFFDHIKHIANSTLFRQPNIEHHSLKRNTVLMAIRFYTKSSQEVTEHVSM